MWGIVFGFRFKLRIQLYRITSAAIGIKDFFAASRLIINIDLIPYAMDVSAKS